AQSPSFRQPYVLLEPKLHERNQTDFPFCATISHAASHPNATAGNGGKREYYICELIIIKTAPKPNSNRACESEFRSA
ncbi:hypothetical protein CSKR_113072, partial [Clonorchis sinensis]